MNQENNYHISFFKPTNEHAKANRNMVIWLVVIWAVAIFGFQVLLRIIEKPTPEVAYTEFEQVWESVENESANKAELQTYAKSTLSVLGKIFLTSDERADLNMALSWTVFQIADSAQKIELEENLLKLQEASVKAELVTDEDYVAQKNEVIAKIRPIVGFDDTDVRAKLAPLEIKLENMDVFADTAKAEIPVIMEKYLIHNQSVLTDTKFLGFPFHYFYTAVFLLILFVGLCVIYCKQTEKINVKFNIED